MKLLKTLGVLIAGIALCAGLAIGSNKLVTRTEKASANHIATCAKKGPNHSVMIKDGTAIPAHTSARLCDALTIKNTDSQIRLMAFGLHEKHQPYDGIEERALDKGQSFTVTLNEAGNFRFHDHLDDSAQGTFSVK